MLLRVVHQRTPVALFLAFAKAEANKRNNEVIITLIAMLIVARWSIDPFEVEDSGKKACCQRFKHVMLFLNALCL